MKSLAKAIVEAVAFIELASDDVIDPDAAVSAMEMIGATLQQASAPELDALRAASVEAFRAEESSYARPAFLEFYQNFTRDFGLEDDEDSSP